MAQKDMAEKTLEAYNDVFADIVNVLLFQGKQVIREENLTDAVTHSVYKADGRLREQERDVAKYVNDSMIRIAFYGIENQTTVDKAMPLRVIGYDGAAYRVQIKKSERKRTGKKCAGKKLKTSSESDNQNILLDSIEANQISQEYYPVITLVLYFGYEQHWDRAKNLKDCLKISDELLPYVKDYEINLVEVAWLTDEQVASFKSDFRIVADYFVQMRKNKNYVPSKDTIQHVDEIFQFMAAMTQDVRFEEYCNQEIERGGGVSMCNTFDEYWNRGLEQGIEQGFERIKRLNILYGILLEKGRLEDLKLAISDSAYRERLMNELLPAES